MSALVRDAPRPRRSSRLAGREDLQRGRGGRAAGRTSTATMPARFSATRSARRSRAALLRTRRASAWSARTLVRFDSALALWMWSMRTRCRVREGSAQPAPSRPLRHPRERGDAPCSVRQEAPHQRSSSQQSVPTLPTAPASRRAATDLEDVTLQDVARSARLHSSGLEHGLEHVPWPSCRARGSCTAHAREGTIRQRLL